MNAVMAFFQEAFDHSYVQVHVLADRSPSITCVTTLPLMISPTWGFLRDIVKVYVFVAPVSNTNAFSAEYVTIGVVDVDT